MRNSMRVASFIFVVLAAGAAANAAVTAVMVENPDVTLAGYTTYDLMVDSDLDWTNARLELVVSYGTIYQYPGPEDDEVVQQSLWSSIPELQWDSWLAAPNLTAPSIIEPVQGSDGWTDTTVYRSWYDTEVTSLTEPFVAARITVTEGAVLTYNGMVWDSESGGIPTLFSGMAAEMGDTDFDGDVDGTDLATLGINWDPVGSGHTWSEGDFDGDGDVDGSDLAFIGLNWNPAGPAGDMMPVPEPATMVLFGFGGLAMIRRRNRS